jgi:hypothetical protein
MTDKPMPWIKQYPHRLHDVRLAQLNDRQQLRYYQLYLLAGHLNVEGAFTQENKPLTYKEIAFFLRVRDSKQLEKDMQAIRKSGLMKLNGHGPYIAEFKDEQIKWMDKQRNERERKKRERASRTSHGSVTRDTSVTANGVTPLEQEQDKTLVVVVADALKMYEEKIGELTPHIRNEIKKLFKTDDHNALGKAINITADQDKHTLAYLKGVFRNLRNGTQKPEPRGAHTSKETQKKKLGDKQVKL